MLSAAIRVVARTAALQIEEVAAAHAYRSVKGKEREIYDNKSEPQLDPRAESLPQVSSTHAEAAVAEGQESEKSEELKEAEAKVQRLLNRYRKSQEANSKKIEALPQDARVPKTVMDHTPGHASNRGTQENHTSSTAGSSVRSDSNGSKEETRLPENTREPKTILPSVSSSSAFKLSTPAESSSSLPEQMNQARAGEAAALGSTSTSQPQSILDPPPASLTDSPSATSNVADVHAFGASSSATEVVEEEDTPVMLRASKVPSSRLGRLFHYGSLAASLSLGAASESIRRTTGGGGQGSVFMSDANVRRLVATLGRMRGAALKLGQFMSIQDNHMLPPEIEKVLQQVQAHANYMPDWQMERVMSEELGKDWESLFSSFDRTPFASASIGQVHKAVLKSTGQSVAVKIQFPGIANSINSDLSNLGILIRSSALLPPGLYLQNTIAVMKRELEDECDYVREAASGRKFWEFLKDDDFFVVPKVVDEATTGKVLTTEWMSGKPLSRMKGMSQETRDKIGTNILRLCLQELFQFRFMQTDPNWANFLYDQQNDKVQLIDFGASREYTKEFMDGWYRLLQAALNGDREIMRVESQNLGYLTGEENEEMLKAHLDSMALVASPFSHNGPYPFEKQTITDSVRALIPIMLKYRLTPPPPETYSLNRKLSGAFLMCARLGAHVDCKKLWEEVVGGYKEG